MIDEENKAKLLKSINWSKFLHADELRDISFILSYCLIPEKQPFTQEELPQGIDEEYISQALMSIKNQLLITFAAFLAAVNIVKDPSEYPRFKFVNLPNNVDAAYLPDGSVLLPRNILLQLVNLVSMIKVADSYDDNDIKAVALGLFKLKVLSIHELGHHWQRLRHNDIYLTTMSNSKKVLGGDLERYSSDFGEAINDDLLIEYLKSEQIRLQSLEEQGSKFDAAVRKAEIAIIEGIIKPKLNT